MVFRAYLPHEKVSAVRWHLQGCSLEEINTRLSKNISGRSLRRWLSLYEKVRAMVVDPACNYAITGNMPELSEEERDFLVEALNKDPSLYSDELCNFLAQANMDDASLSLAALDQELNNRISTTREIVPTLSPSQSILQREAFISDIRNIPTECLIFLDESMICSDSLRDTQAGAARRKRTKMDHHNPLAKQYGVLPAASLSGLLTQTVRVGSIKSVDFAGFLERFLLPMMNPYPERNSVLIMDNARIHHTRRVDELCERSGLHVIYLPPDSPDFNPVERGLLVLKAYLHKQQAKGDDTLNCDMIYEAVAKVFTADSMAELLRESGLTG